MKKVISLICNIILSMAFCHAQNNLILNGSFEDVNGCPWVNNTINEGYVNNISNPNSFTPDYFSYCYTLLGIPYIATGTPSNARGYQMAKTGNAYTGIGLWQENYIVSEYLQLKIKDSLKPNHHYAFECYLSRAEKFRNAVSNFGAYFSVDSVFMPAADILPFVPQINNPAGNYFTDTLNWMPFTGTFLAQGGEKYVVLGNFNAVAENIDTLYQYYILNSANGYQQGTNCFNWAYYYIDDVSLIDLDSTLTVKENEAMAQVELFPNPAASVLNIKLNAPQQQYGIIDIKGNTLMQNSIIKQEQLQIDITALPSGFYVINFINKQGYITREKIVKI
jgi:hypothetical protein